jgi:hypothetical protein
VEIQIHLLDLLTKDSYSEKYNFRPKAGIAGPQVGLLLPATYSCIFRSCSWLDLINVYTFSLDNFHLQHSSIIIQSSGMRTNSLYPKQHMAPFLGEISLFNYKYFKYVQIVDQQCSNILNSHMMGIAGSQVRFEAREPIVAFFAAVPGN